MPLSRAHRVGEPAQRSGELAHQLIRLRASRTPAPPVPLLGLNVLTILLKLLMG